VEEWSEAAVCACRLHNATASFEALFGRPCSTKEGFLFEHCLDQPKLSKMLRERQNGRAELRFARPNSQVRTVRVSIMWAPEVTGPNVVLVVCHDLTDFKERVELEKDRELISSLQVGRGGSRQLVV
jgi:hypothetical protein